MTIRLLLLVCCCIAATVHSQDECSVCGEGKQVGNPCAIFEFPGQPAVPFPNQGAVPCDVLETAGKAGLITNEVCEFLPALLGVCECRSTQAYNPTSMPKCAPPTPTSPPIAKNTIQPMPTITRAPVTVSGCSVCGEGGQVGNPDGIFEFPGQPAVPCDVLENAGKDGLIPIETCGVLPPLLGVCDCQPLTGPTPAPTCSVCGEGKQVGNPDGIFEFPGQPEVPCGVVEDAGKNGEIPMCEFLPPLLSVCECEPIAPIALATTSRPSAATNTPSAAVVPTDTPVLLKTIQPTPLDPAVAPVAPVAPLAPVAPAAQPTDPPLDAVTPTPTLFQTGTTPSEDRGEKEAKKGGKKQKRN